MPNDILEVNETPHSNNSGFLTLIEKLVMSPDIDVLKLEKMLDMQERIMNKQAEISFNQAMSRVSQKLPRILKGGSVGYKADKNNKNSDTVEAFKFARYEDIDAVVRPLLAEEGFSLSFNTDMREGGGVVMHGTLSHIEGHSRTASIPLALDLSGGKNNIQAMGSTTSYGRRYTLCMLLNIVTAGEDDDGKGADEVLDTEKAVEIDLLIKEVAADKTKFLKYMGVDDVRKIKDKDYQKAMNALKAKKTQAAKEKK